MAAGYQVLAVDDSAFTLTIISTYLEDSEFEVVQTARNGTDALEHFKRLEPDVVLLDIIMPGLSGPETLEQILAIDPAAKVIMVSSLGTEEAVEQCLALGAKSFLQKPFSKEGLIEFLRRVFDAPEEPAGP